MNTKAETKLSEFDYDLPKERIAQEPLVRRDSSRLLVYDRATQEVVEHARFYEIERFLPPESLLILNDTRVFPARVLGKKLSGGKVEFLLIRREQMQKDDLEEVWIALAKTSKGIHKSMVVEFHEGFSATLVEIAEPGEGKLPPLWRVCFSASADTGGVSACMHRIGMVPLPPYIRRKKPKEIDRERYQTVYARREGSSAAPTAGLHFTSELLQSLTAKKIHISYITLHVGPGTFLPVRDEEVENHKMHEEFFEISQETVLQFQEARAKRRPIVAVGTTAVRALESAVTPKGELKAGEGKTDLFIRPGYTFRAIDAMITNFHLPRSTLLMLVCAFGGKEGIQKAYQEAILQEYRFYSYGDAMLIR